MEIKVNGYLTFKEIFRDQSLQIDDAEKITLVDLLEVLSRECEHEIGVMLFDPEAKEPRRDLAVLVNGIHDSHLPDRLDTELKDGDEVAIFPPIVGG